MLIISVIVLVGQLHADDAPTNITQPTSESTSAAGSDATAAPPTSSPGPGPTGEPKPDNQSSAVPLFGGCWGNNTYYVRIYLPYICIMWGVLLF